MSDYSDEYTEIDKYFLGLYQFWRNISVDIDYRPNTLDEVEEALNALSDALVYFREEVEDEDNT